MDEGHFHVPADVFTREKDRNVSPQASRDDMELSETGAESACPVPPDHVEVAGTGDPAPWTPDCVTDVQSGPPGGPVVTSKDTAGPEASGSAEETGPGAALDQQDGSLTQYRDDGSEDFSSDSDSDSSSSSSSSSSSGGPLHIVLEDIDYEDAGVGNGRKQTPLKTQDELLVEDLPAVEELAITLPESTVLQPVGTISSIIDKLVIIQSLKDIPPLNDDTVIFNKDRLAIGRVFEVFGPVVQPFYVLRFNSEEHIQQKELRTQETMYFAPDLTDLTAYIFTEQLKQLKGSDASWKNDQEPPPEALDFSDDEQELLAKRKLKEKRQPKSDTDGGGMDNQKQTFTRATKQEHYQARRVHRQGRGARLPMPPNPCPGYHANLHTIPPPMDLGYPFSFHYPPPPPMQVPPGCPGFPPPPHMTWPPHPFPGFMFPPPPPPPPPPPQ